MSLISYQENPEPFLNSYARHAMYPASFTMIHCALMAHRAIAQFGSAPLWEQDVVGSNPASPTNKKAWNLNDSGLLLLSGR